MLYISSKFANQEPHTSRKPHAQSQKNNIAVERSSDLPKSSIHQPFCSAALQLPSFPSTNKSNVVLVHPGHKVAKVTGCGLVGSGRDVCHCLPLAYGINASHWPTMLCKWCSEFEDWLCSERAASLCTKLPFTLQAPRARKCFQPFQSTSWQVHANHAQHTRHSQSGKCSNSMM